MFRRLASKARALPVVQGAPGADGAWISRPPRYYRDWPRRPPPHRSPCMYYQPIWTTSILGAVAPSKRSDSSAGPDPPARPSRRSCAVRMIHQIHAASPRHPDPRALCFARTITTRIRPNQTLVNRRCFFLRKKVRGYIPCRKPDIPRPWKKGLR